MIPTPHNITVKRPTFTSDSSGGKVPTYNTIANYKAFVQNSSPDMVEDYRKREIRITHSIYCNTQPDLQVEDLIEWNGKNLFVRVAHDLCNLGKVYRILAEERQ